MQRNHLILDFWFKQGDSVQVYYKRMFLSKCSGDWAWVVSLIDVDHLPVALIIDLDVYLQDRLLISAPLNLQRSLEAPELLREAVSDNRFVVGVKAASGSGG